MAKKKMTKAQAAAARHEVTANDIAKKKAHEDNQYMKEVRRRAQKKANKSVGFSLIVPIVLVVVVVVLCLVLTNAPGKILGI